MSGSYSAIEGHVGENLVGCYKQRKATSGHVLADYLVQLGLNDGQMTPPSKIATKDWLLEWLETQNEFSDRIQ